MVVLAPDERGKIASNDLSICEIERPAYPQPLCSPSPPRPKGVSGLKLHNCYKAKAYFLLRSMM
jgi:hypothetical protein